MATAACWFILSFVTLSNLFLPLPVILLLFLNRPLNNFLSLFKDLTALSTICIFSIAVVSKSSCVPNKFICSDYIEKKKNIYEIRNIEEKYL